jgi:hypothetical protein
MNTILKHKALKADKKAEKTANRPPAPGRQLPPDAIDALLDEALEETFPASDPVALTQPSRRRRAALKKGTRRRPSP